MRPHIICHMTTSIDGRLHPSRFTVPAEGISRDVLRGHYAKVYELFAADGWIVGRRTMSEMAKGSERSIANAPKVPREPHLANRNGRKLAIGIDPSGRAHYGKDNVQGDHVVAVLGEQVSDAYLAELREDGVSYSSRARRATIWRARWSNSLRCSASRSCCLKAAPRSTELSSSTD